MTELSRAFAESECARLGVIFCPHSESQPRTNVKAWTRLAGYDGWVDTVWMTQDPYIYHPDSIVDPFEHWVVVLHELVHIRQQRESCFVFWWAIKYGASEDFRYRMEREAHLVDIALGRRTAAHVAARLRSFYGIDRSVVEMREWFEDNALETA